MSEDEIQSEFSFENAKKSKNKELDLKDKIGDEKSKNNEVAQIGDLEGGFNEDKKKPKSSKTDSSQEYQELGSEGINLQDKSSQNHEKDTISKTMATNEITSLDQKIDGLMLDKNTCPQKILDLSEHYQEDQPQSKADELGQALKTESETNFIYEAVQQKLKTSYTLPEPKFDYSK